VHNEHIVRPFRVFCSGIFLLFLLPMFWAQNMPTQEALRAVDQLVDRSEPIHLAEALTKQYGPRLTGSRHLRQATGWAVHEMNRAGLSHVHTESWTMARGWRRLHAKARLTQPYRSALTVSSYGWSGSSHGAVQGDVVLVDGNAKLTEESAHEWTGKIVLVAPVANDGIRAVADARILAELAEKAHALAVIDGIGRPGRDIVHTGPIGFPGQTTSVPFLDMPATQRQELEALVRKGAAPRLEIDIANKFTQGPVTAENVVGDIQGSVHPEQIVLVGAHLDSWDLSSGAADDAAGVAAVLAAARAIRSSGVHPDRTIRFVLFSGEEQGLLGSRAYVERHRKELANYVCALIMDWGAGPITRFPLAGHAELGKPLDDLFSSSDALNSIHTSSGFLTFTDGFAFTLAGLPGIGLLQDSPNYDRVAHSTEDSLQAIDADALRFNTRVLALSALWLSDWPQKPGTIFTESKNEQALHPVRNVLRLLGMWPYEHTTSPN